MLTFQEGSCFPEEKDFPWLHKAVGEGRASAVHSHRSFYTGTGEKVVCQPLARTVSSTMRWSRHLPWAFWGPGLARAPQPAGKWAAGVSVSAPCFLLSPDGASKRAGIQTPGVPVPALGFTSCWPWASHLISLSFLFLILK